MFFIPNNPGLRLYFFSSFFW